MLKPKPKTKPDQLLFNFRWTVEERAAIQAKADLYTNGKLAAWVRYAAMTCVPPAEDLIEGGPDSVLGF